MNEQIHNIVIGYINDGDYEKALSLMQATPLEGEEDKALLEQCKSAFASDCATKIAKAVKAQDKATAESILATYKKLIGGDSNNIIYQTLIDGIDTSKDKQNKSNPKEFLSKGFFDGCTPNPETMRSKITWIVWGVLMLICLICGTSATSSVEIIITAIAQAVMLGYFVLKAQNNRFKPIGLVLLLIFVITVFGYYNRDIDWYPSVRDLHIPWLASFASIIVYNAVTSSKSWTFRCLISLILFTIFNPAFYGIRVAGMIESWTEGRTEYSIGTTHYGFVSGTNFFIFMAFACSMIIYMGTLIGFKKLWQKIVLHKRLIMKVAGALILLAILAFISVGIKSCHDEKVAREEAIEQARRDSIQAVENARVAAIERARQDSIAAVRAKEQARKDSIDYAQHAGFVNKYNNVGLIITELQMTNGTTDNGVAAKGVKFTIFNPTHKTIKYVIAVCQAVNKFNDKISNIQRCRGMGPIDSHEYGSWDFNDVFPDRNDVIDDVSVYFQVIYTNGSTKTIRWKDAYVNDFKASWFKGR